MILSDPYYACYPKFVKFSGGVPVYVPVEESDAFQFRPEEVAAPRHPADQGGCSSTRPPTRPARC